MTWEGESYYPLDGGSNMAEMQMRHGKIKYLANVGLFKTSQLVYEQS